ncbi:MAG: acetyl/propionyl/methylcrotonyl-CoA carboxylase subunit alpha [Hyphomicrobiales bacterium]|nr:acetyl/propionyl/methylcrotonyl-CoA carboxylase subunit alpha [Hyphomicrobiales bacterium]MDE2114605.1 acetyl/propionyl/methylcrotonyl-CoA carboxylase subunit alpha [Hyphomicrobiales bacterium]
MFAKVLIANRGEIACRIIRTLARLGIKSVAVYSHADRDALHVRLADEAVAIGPAPAAQSYLNADAVLQAAIASGAQAVHPGYGFLSENAAFADQCQAAGLVFIGPPPDAIRAMGSKSASKILMAKAQVPLVPGYHGDNQDAAFLADEARKIGYPVLIKASAGGGGKGMRIVTKPTEFDAALGSCQREAQQSFGDAKVLLEKYIQQPRHIEMQVFADKHGHVVHIFERDCSVQRRHQKVLEEAPAPGLSEALRQQMGKAACDAARAVGYEGAGTVEFIVDQAGTFHFMEMNTRLQVEHPVTEMLTGLDLVEWQLRVAAGEPLPLAQAEIVAQGHALEARVYAEDPDNGFLPAAGTLSFLHMPAQNAGLRIDTGVTQGDAITPYYDPMIAKLIVHRPTRAAALTAMHAALAQFQIAGLTTNIAFLARLIESPAFRAADLDTSLIEREHAVLFPKPVPLSDTYGLAAALYECLQASEPNPEAGRNESSPWTVQDGWRIGSHAARALTFQAEDRQIDVHAQALGQGEFSLTLKGVAHAAQGQILPDGILRFTLAGHTRTLRIVALESRRVIFDGATIFYLTLLPRLRWASAERQETGSLNAPMPGKIVAHLVAPGTEVAPGTPLLILEAMKMEHTIKAPGGGIVEAFHYGEGEQVSEGVELVHFKPNPAPQK